MREPPKRLGRGLAALLGQEADPEPPRGDLRQLAVDALEPSPGQPRARIDADALTELAQSIAQQGVLQPLLVRPIEPLSGLATARFQIVAGERRWHAARQAGLGTVPCLVQTLTDQAAALATLVENLQREGLEPLEEAEGFHSLLERFGLTHDELARAVGKSRSHVANTLRLLGLPPAVLAALQAGSITAGHARALLAQPDPTAALRAVLARGLSVRATEALAAGRATAPERPQAGADWSGESDPVDLVALESRLAEALGLRVRITGAGRRGRVVIDYRTVDQLEGLLARLMPG